MCMCAKYTECVYVYTQCVCAHRICVCIDRQADRLVHGLCMCGDGWICDLCALNWLVKNSRPLLFSQPRNLSPLWCWDFSVVFPPLPLTLACTLLAPCRQYSVTEGGGGRGRGGLGIFCWL